jgi:predicted dehydrogenase
MTDIRWGLLSTARINRKIIPALRESKRGCLIAAASRDPVKAQEYIQQWKIPLAFGSYQDMLSSGKVDAVYISLPNHLHAEWTIKALRRGIHVLCEKPFAISIEEVDRVIQASQEGGAIAAEAFMYRHHPQTKQVLDFIQSGNLGEVEVIRGIFSFLMGEKGRQSKSLNVRMVPEYGGGSLWDVGIYPLSYAQLVLGGPPRWVFGSQVVGPTGVDEVFSGQMGFNRGGGSEVLAQINGSFNSPYFTKMEVIGREGQLTITRPFNNINRKARLIYRNRKGISKTIRVPKKSLYLGEVEDLEAAILDGTDPLISLAETRNHILTALALRQSAREGQQIYLENFPQGR